MILCYVNTAKALNNILFRKLLLKFNNYCICSHEFVSYLCNCSLKLIITYKIVSVLAQVYLSNPLFNF